MIKDILCLIQDILHLSKSILHFSQDILCENKSILGIAKDILNVKFPFLFLVQEFTLASTGNRQQRFELTPFRSRGIRTKFHLNAKVGSSSGQAV